MATPAPASTPTLTTNYPGIPSGPNQNYTPMNPPPAPTEPNYSPVSGPGTTSGGYYFNGNVWVPVGQVYSGGGSYGGNSPSPVAQAQANNAAAAIGVGSSAVISRPSSIPANVTQGGTTYSVIYNERTGATRLEQVSPYSQQAASFIPPSSGYVQYQSTPILGGLAVSSLSPSEVKGLQAQGQQVTPGFTGYSITQATQSQTSQSLAPTSPQMGDIMTGSVRGPAGYFQMPTTASGIFSKALTEYFPAAFALAGEYAMISGFAMPKPIAETTFSTKSVMLTDREFQSLTKVRTEVGAKTYYGISESKTLLGESGMTSKSFGSLVIAEDAASSKFISGITKVTGKTIVADLNVGGVSRQASIGTFEPTVGKPTVSAVYSLSKLQGTSDLGASYTKLGVAADFRPMTARFSGIESVTFPSTKTFTNILIEQKQITVPKATSMDIIAAKTVESVAIKEATSASFVSAAKGFPAVLTGTAVRVKTSTTQIMPQIAREMSKSAAATMTSTSAISRIIAPSEISTTRLFAGYGSVTSELSKITAITGTRTGTQYPSYQGFSLPATMIPAIIPPMFMGGGENPLFGKPKKGRRRKYAYTPSLGAFVFGIRGKKPKGPESQLRLRPITKGWSWSKTLRESGLW